MLVPKDGSAPDLRKVQSKVKLSDLLGGAAHVDRLQSFQRQRAARLAQRMHNFGYDPAAMVMVCRTLFLTRLHNWMVKVAVLARPHLSASTVSSDCVRRLAAALRTREARPSASDPTGRPWPSSHTPPTLPFSLRLTTIQAQQGPVGAVAVLLQGADRGGDLARADAPPSRAAFRGRELRQARPARPHGQSEPSW